MTTSVIQLPSETAPGAYRVARERRGAFATLAKRAPENAFWIVDARLARLHPVLQKVLRSRKHLLIRAGESAKHLRTLETILVGASALPRSGWLVVVGGGTLGDLGTLAAHLIKRGVRLLHVPTTLLAAVDSSLGGKGAVDVPTKSGVIKNGAGAFHYADETWLAPEFFSTLTSRQVREGLTELWKMVVCLDGPLFKTYERSIGRTRSLTLLVRDARRLKAEVCRRDPYELNGIRPVLNFGHTVGHVIETLSRFSISHGDAVGLGIRCALDVGQAVGVTPEHVARDVESAFERGVGILPRSRLASVFSEAPANAVFSLLLADKKNVSADEIRMVLLARPGTTVLKAVSVRTLRTLIAKWKKGERP